MNFTLSQSVFDFFFGQNTDQSAKETKNYTETIRKCAIPVKSPSKRRRNPIGLPSRNEKLT